MPFKLAQPGTGSSSGGSVSTGPRLQTVAGKGLVPVAHSRTSHAASGLSDGVATSATYETLHSIGGPCDKLHFLFTGYGTIGEPLTDAYRLKLSVKITTPGGTYFVPLRWADGSRLKTIDPGSIAIAGPLDWSWTAADANGSASLALRQYVEVDSGKKWPLRYTGTGNEKVEFAADRTDVNGTLTAQGGNVFGPTAILGIPTGAAGIKSICMYGDSIAVAGTNGSSGWLSGGLGQNVPALNVAVNTERGRRDLLEHGIHFNARVAIGEHATNALWQYGANDVWPSATNSLAQLEASLLQFCAMKKLRSIPVFATTITPYTTSTDSWATAGNQTVFDGPQELVRQAYNDWLRDGAPYNTTTLLGAATGSSGAGIIRAGQSGHPLAYEGCGAMPDCTYPGYIDVADALETARNSGKWKAGHTGDGLHPNQTGYTAMATKVSATPLAT